MSKLGSEVISKSLFNIFCKDLCQIYRFKTKYNMAMCLTISIIHLVYRKIK